MHAYRHPLLQPHISTLEQEPELLSVHAARLRKPMIKVHDCAIAITHAAVDLLLDVRAGPQCPLRRHNFARPEPARKHVEEMHPMLDKNSAALPAVPKPVLGTEPFIAGVVLKVAMQELAERLRFDQLLDRPIE